MLMAQSKRCWGTEGSVPLKPGAAWMWDGWQQSIRLYWVKLRAGASAPLLASPADFDRNGTGVRGSLFRIWVYLSDTWLPGGRGGKLCFWSRARSNDSINEQRGKNSLLLSSPFSALEGIYSEEKTTLPDKRKYDRIWYPTLFLTRFPCDSTFLSITVRTERPDLRRLCGFVQK